MTPDLPTNITCIDTMALGCPRLIASYLVRGSKQTALIDPGFASSVETILKGLNDAGSDVAELDYIIVTHTHVDHAGAVGTLLEMAPKARVAVHPRGVYLLRNPGKIAGGGRMVFGPSLSAQFGEVKGVAPERILAVSDGETLDLGGGTALRFIYTPGHSSDHMSILETATGTMFTGDAFCLHYPDLGHVLIPAGSPPLFDCAAAIKDIEHFRGPEIKHLATPHFGLLPGEQPAGDADAAIRAIQQTRGFIQSLFGEGLEFPQLVERLQGNVLERAGATPESIPAFMRDEWLPAMLRTGLMGFMADIMEYARYPRTFKEFSC